MKEKKEWKKVFVASSLSAVFLLVSIGAIVASSDFHGSDFEMWFAGLSLVTGGLSAAGALNAMVSTVDIFS